MMNSSASNSNLITAITELEDGKLVSILDVEQILATVVGEPRLPDIPSPDGDRSVPVLRG
jgi:two-component system chemotaxis response regulator CheV